MIGIATRALRARSRWLCALAIAGMATTGTNTARADLIGDEVQWWGYSQFTGEETLKGTAEVTDPFFEFANIIFDTTIFTLNVGANSVRMDVGATFFSPWFSGGNPETYLEIRDLDWIGQPDAVIESIDVSFSGGISVTATSPDGFAPFSEDRITFTDDTVRIAYGGYGFVPGSFIQIDITTIPSPGAGALLVPCALIGVRRERRGQARGRACVTR